MNLSSNLEISPYNRKIRHSGTVIDSNTDDNEFKKVRAITQISPKNEKSKKFSPIHSPTHKKSNLFGLFRTQSFKNSVSLNLFDFLYKGEKEDKQKKKNIIWENFKKNPQYLLIENGTLNIEDVDQEHILELAVELMQKPPKNRKINDVKILKKITEKIDFFQSRGSEVHEQCVKAMNPQFIPKGKTIFEMGTVGHTFYVIFKGSVGIWVNIPKIQKEEKNGIVEEKVEMVLTEIKQLSAGASFGELALIEKKPRAATIICREDSIFGVLDRRNFDKILKEIEQKKLYQQVEFFATMKIFSKWSYNAVKTLYLYTDQRRFMRNQIVYHEGDEYDSLYMVKSGEFEILLTIRIPNKSFFHSEIDEMNISSPPYVLKNYPIATVTIGETFGEEELIYKIRRHSTVKCTTTTGELYMLNRKEFYRRVYSDENACNWLKKQIEIRRNARKLRIDNFVKLEKKIIGNDNKNNISSLLGDFSQFKDNNKTFHINNNKIKPFYSKDPEKLGEFEKPYKAIEKLERKTPYVQDPGNYNVKSLLFEGILSPKKDHKTSFLHKYKSFFSKNNSTEKKNNKERKLSLQIEKSNLNFINFKNKNLSINIIPKRLKEKLMLVSDDINNFVRRRKSETERKIFEKESQNNKLLLDLRKSQFIDNLKNKVKKYKKNNQINEKIDKKKFMGNRYQSLVNINNI